MENKFKRRLSKYMDKTNEKPNKTQRKGRVFAFRASPKLEKEIETLAKEMGLAPNAFVLKAVKRYSETWRRRATPEIVLFGQNQFSLDYVKQLESAQLEKGKV